TVAAAPAQQVTLAGDEVPDRDLGHTRTDLDHLTAELVAHHQGRPDCLLRPLVPGLDVQVGAAQAGGRDLDQHVPVPDRRLRNLGQLQTRVRPRLDQCLHPPASLPQCRPLPGAGPRNGTLPGTAGCRDTPAVATDCSQSRRSGQPTRSSPIGPQPSPATWCETICGVAARYCGNSCCIVAKCGESTCGPAPSSVNASIST